MILGSILLSHNGNTVSKSQIIYLIGNSMLLFLPWLMNNSKV